MEARRQGAETERGRLASSSLARPAAALRDTRGLDGVAVPFWRAPAWWAAQAVILVAAAYYFFPLVGCLDRCFVDLQALGSHRLVELEASDMRLNAWILGWVQRALFDPALALFDSNTFHPARAGLTGSEHMVGVALQTLPLRSFTPDAVALHQGALVLSTLVLGWTSFALVRWGTASVWAALVAALAAMFAPWRLTELPHLQLLSVQWMPLVWLLVARIAVGDSGRGGAVLLAAVLSLQLLSSYYLAYFTTLSIAVLLAVLFLRHRFGLRAAITLAAAAAVPYAALGWLSLPYLARDRAAELVAEHGFLASSTLDRLWAATAPALRFSWEGAPGIVEYALPAVTFMLAVIALAVLGERLPDPAAARGQGRAADALDSLYLTRAKTLVLALFAIVLAACVLSLGRRLWIGGEHWTLPGSWLSAVVPGFSVLRVSHRWLILVGVAAPLLAGFGVFGLERWLRLAPAGMRLAALGIGRLLVAAGLVATLPWHPALPVKAAMPGLQRVASAYDALSLLPPGPAVEIPWPLTVLDGVVRESRYTLASTLHWKPILNGFTAYAPPSYPLLHRVAQELPDPGAIRALRALSGLRYIVLHIHRLTAGQKLAWRGADGTGLLELVHRDPNVRIYRIADARDAGVWVDAVSSREPRDRTLAGVSREPLSIEPGSGGFEVAIPEEIPAFSNDRPLLRLALAIDNRSGHDWPGLDVQREGLVELRYRFSQSAGAAGEGVIEASAPLDVDLPAGSRRTAVVHLEAPPRPGAYRLELELAQRRGDRWVALPLGSVEAPVRVTR